MAITVESNFPNSRITAQLQADDVDHPGQIIGIQGQVVSGTPNKNALMVQIAQPSGSSLATNANINEYQGMTSFNLSNAFIPEGYDDIQISYTPTTDVFAHYKGATHIADIVLTYADATKQVLTRVQRV